MTTCQRCGREGSRGFKPAASDGLTVCDSEAACRRRVEEAEARIGVHRSERGDNHVYKLDGQRMPGVTTLIKDGLPAPALVGWGIRETARYAAQHLEELWAMRGMGEEAVFASLRQAPYKKRNDAGVRGTKLHQYAERYMRGDKLGEVPADVLPFVHSMADFIDDYQPRSLLSEVALGSRRWRYCGTLDDVAVFPDGVVRVVDYKTGNGIYPEVCLQLAAYANPEAVYKDPLTRVERAIADLGIGYEHRNEVGALDGGYAVHIRPEGYRVLPAAIGPEVLQAFLRVAWVARLRAKDGDLDSWLGDPLPAFQREVSA